MVKVAIILKIYVLEGLKISPRTVEKHRSNIIKNWD